ncbi:MAG: allophanate hydrolase, partial [Silicimonas sp.]|nr:allophanate hydrolase [Silicimonas sp.]
VGTGTTAVLAVSGGIDVPLVLGSRATYARAALGGIAGRAMQAGDRLPLGRQKADEPLAYPDPPADTDDPIRVVLGPQDDHFEPAALTAFFEGRYTVTDKVDRMGMRLDGPALAHRAPELAQIASDGTVPGSVQVPGNGQPIVLLADGQTVGGYPKIATVISADLPRLARRAPGDQVRFVGIEVDVAEHRYRTQMASLRAKGKQARPASQMSGIDLRRLYASNLISGIVDMTRSDHFPGNVE